MNFNQLSYWPFIVLAFVFFFVVTIKMESTFFNLIKKYWFYKRSFFHRISTSIFLIGMGGLLISLLDLRGPEEKIKTEVPSDRTIILMDTSASMLAEDVKPSRLQKAALIAKHFARKAAGHQLSIVAFAEIQKKIVPFTNDLDLIDARLDSLKTLRNHYGSSALSLAIQESIQYFQETGGEARGNIIVFTDGEETAEGIDLKIPKDIHVAMVGVGTSQGGRIPLDDGRGFRYGYKKEKGRDIISTLNEVFFKQVVSQIPSGKYWLANSYSLPSEEVLEFFNGEKEKSKNTQDMVIKPVYVEKILIPSIILLLLSYIFKSIRVFTLGLVLVMNPSYSQEEAPKLSPKTIKDLESLQKGNLNKVEKLKLADDLLKSGAKDESITLFNEELTGSIDNQIPPEAYLNYGTALLEKGNISEGLQVYNKLSEILDNSENSKKIKEMMNRNVLTSFQKQEQKKKQKSEGKDQEDKKDQDQNQSNNGTNQDKNTSNSSGQKDQKNNNSEQNKDEKKDQNQKGDKKEEDSQEENEDKDKDQNKQDGENKKIPPQKLPAKLKQLMSDDRQLQMKMIENGTKDLNRRKSRKSKDW